MARWLTIGVAVALLLGLSILLITILTYPTIEDAKGVSCMNNLGQLLKMQKFYATKFGGPKTRMPEATGADFWLVLAKTDPPLITPDNYDVFVCPLSDDRVAPGFTTYRGPGKVADLLSAEDPIGCCNPGSHPDGSINVIFKSGDVMRVYPDDSIYVTALKSTLGAKESNHDKQR